MDFTITILLFEYNRCLFIESWTCHRFTTIIGNTSSIQNAYQKILNFYFAKIWCVENNCLLVSWINFVPTSPARGNGLLEFMKAIGCFDWSKFKDHSCGNDINGKFYRCYGVEQKETLRVSFIEIFVRENYFFEGWEQALLEIDGKTLFRFGIFVSIASLGFKLDDACIHLESIWAISLVMVICHNASKTFASLLN